MMWFYEVLVNGELWYLSSFTMMSEAENAKLVKLAQSEDFALGDLEAFAYDMGMEVIRYLPLDTVIDEEYRLDSKELVRTK